MLKTGDRIVVVDNKRHVWADDLPIPCFGTIGEKDNDGDFIIYFDNYDGTQYLFSDCEGSYVTAEVYNTPLFNALKEENEL